MEVDGSMLERLESIYISRLSEETRDLRTVYFDGLVREDILVERVRVLSATISKTHDINYDNRMGAACICCGLGEGDCKDIVCTSGGNSYDSISPNLLKEVRSLNSKNDTLEKRIKELESEIRRLRKETADYNRSHRANYFGTSEVAH